MPVFFQHQVNDHTRLGIWKIEESEDFFLTTVPLQREVTHPHKRLQHLAGRFLLQFLFPGFPYELIKIADTRKPYLPAEEYHFSISHSGDYAAAIVSKTQRVGLDIEVLSGKAEKIMHKFLTPAEQSELLPPDADSKMITRLWSAKESVFKWFGSGGVDFREHIRIVKMDEASGEINCQFLKSNQHLTIQSLQLRELVMAWVVS